MDSLVDVAWLQAHLDDSDLRIIDCTVAFELGEGGRLTFFSGRAAYDKAHIPGSGFADILNDLSDTSSPYQFTLPSADRFTRAMEALGIGEGTRVVLYDTTYTMWATRVWWMLQAFGFDNAAVLDGGFTAWQAAGAPVTDVPAEVPSATFKAVPRDGWFVGTEEVQDAIAKPTSTCVIDALMFDMYTGAQTPYSRPGHIPGAINVPAVAVVDPDTRLFISEEKMREYFAPALSDPEQAVITYCGGGIAATADGFLLRRLGKQNVAVYDGSMAQWSSDARLPLVLGDDPL
jgi:thiosulfate/3-mercaptopyruvate sulfurtransferase